MRSTAWEPPAEIARRYEAPLVAAIFRARELVLGATAAAPRPPQGLLAEMEALGWVVLASAPGVRWWPER